MPNSIFAHAHLHLTHFRPASAHLLSAQRPPTTGAAAAVRPPPLPPPPPARLPTHHRHCLLACPPTAATHSQLGGAAAARACPRTITAWATTQYPPPSAARLPAHPRRPPAAQSSHALALIHASRPPLRGGAGLLFRSRAADHLRPCARRRGDDLLFHSSAARPPAPRCYYSPIPRRQDPWLFDAAP
jgi:hypothetical protein